MLFVSASARLGGELVHSFHYYAIENRLDYQPLFGKMSPGDGGNRAYIEN